MNIDKTIKDRKIELLSYFRDRASEALTAIKVKFAETQSDKRARAINGSLNQTKSVLITTLLQQAEKEKWTNQEKLECVLMITYSNIVVMIESRNSVRPYEYMDFSRRVGELWNPFCKLCFYYPINNLSLFIPPLFSEVKKKMTHEIADYIDKLTITPNFAGIFDISEISLKKLKYQLTPAFPLIINGFSKIWRYRPLPIHRF